jgi:2-dehydro-3-deoxyglucarate aldolase
MNIKYKLNNKKVVVGSWITLAHPGIAEIMASSGFDWLAVDLEHSTITIKDAEELIRIISLSGVTPLVRLTSNNEDQIKRIMDAGADGVIVPMIKTVDDVMRVVGAIKYPPQGNRGVGLARAQGYGARFNEYLDWQKDNSIIIIQIEHIDAVNNLEALLAIDEVDGFIIGPYDLSASMGIPGQFNHVDFIAAMKKITEIASRIDVPSGIHIIEPDIEQLKKRIEDGYRFIAYSLDIRMLDVSCSNAVNRFCELLGKK